MLKVLEFTGYRLKLMLRDRVMLAALLIIPLLFTLLAGSVQKYEKTNRIPVVLVDQDQSEYSKLLVARFSRAEGVDVILLDEPKAKAKVENFAAEAAFVIKPGFKEAILREQVDGTIKMLKSPNSLAAGIIEEMLAGEIMRLVSNAASANWVEREYSQYDLHMEKQPEDLWKGTWQYADSLWEPKPLMVLEYEEAAKQGVESPQRNSIPVLSTTSLGMLLMFLLLFILANCSWLIEENQNFTLKRIVLIPGLLGRFFLAHILALFVLASLVVVCFVLITGLVFKANIFISLWQFLIIGAYILSAISLGMFMAAWLKTPRQLQSTLPMVVLLTSFVGGCFWSFMDLSHSLKILSRFTPQGWALASMLDILANNYTMGEVLQAVGVLLFSALALFSLSYQ
ncbi:MAG TPA: ABC transporter permease, partial [Verrucomicrobiae bacterium]|nr:ABC transporter permease [Verrucomicrobiae bacterium]